MKKDDDDITIGGDFRLGSKVNVAGTPVDPVGAKVNVVGPVAGPPIRLVNASAEPDDPDASPTGPVTPLEAAAVEVWARDSQFFVLKHSVPRVVAEWRQIRALLAELKDEGCPTGEDGRCVYCDGEWIGDAPSGEPMHRHAEKMEDGQPCLWLRIERA